MNRHHHDHCDHDGKPKADNGPNVPQPLPDPLAPAPAPTPEPNPAPVPEPIPAPPEPVPAPPPPPAPKPPTPTPPAPTPTPPPVDVAPGATWKGVLQASDMGKHGPTFFQQDKSPWPVHDGVNGPPPAQARLTLGMAPGNVPAIKCLAPKGMVQNWNFSLKNFADQTKVTHVRAGMRIYIPDGFQWGHDQKLALGLWGGKIGKLSGGASVEQQTGYSIRLVHSPSQGAMLYSYHLNRGAKNGTFGIGIGQHTGKLATGRWHSLEMELRLNRPGSSDGTVWLYHDGKQVSQVNGLQYRHDNGWGIAGIMIHDMWGGNDDAPPNFSPKNQEYFYTDYFIKRIA